jgi:hypothetical protein
MKKDDGPVIIARSLLLWGDPHIVTIYGKSYMMKDIEGVFRLFENNELLIKGEFWTLNKFNNHPVLHNRTFMKKITINFKNHHLNIKIDINKTKAYLLLGDNKEIEIENKKDFIMNDFRITHHNKIKTVDIYKNINTKSIRFENNDFYIELFNVDHIDDLQNFFEINTKYLSKSSYNDKARGLLIKNCEENYEVINSMS